MLRRAAATLNGRAAAWFRRVTRRPVTLPAAYLGRHHPQAQLQPPRVVPAPQLPHLCGARGYARMARRIPIVKPDGYSTSDGEAEEPGAPDFGEITKPVGAGAEGDDSDDSEFEVEGYMMDFGSLLGSDDGDGDGDGNGNGKGNKEGMEEGRK